MPKQATWMKNIMTGLKVNKISLVPAGADSSAHIKIFKSLGGENSMTFEEIIAKMKPEDAAVIQEHIEKMEMNMTEEQKMKYNKMDTEAKMKYKKMMMDDMKKKDMDMMGMKKERDDMSAKLAKAEAELKVAKGINDDDEEEILKSLDPAVRVMVEKARTQAKAAETAVKKMQDAQNALELVQKCNDIPNIGAKTEDLQEVLKSCKSAGGDVFDKVYGVLKSVDEILTDSEQFKEIGSSTVAKSGTADAAWAELEKAAVAIAGRDKITKEAAVAKAMDEHPELYERYIELS